MLFKKLSGIGYIGKPIFCKGLRGISINRRFRIFPGSRIECLKFGKIFIGENVSIGHNLFIQTSSRINIGSNVNMSANVFIGSTDYSIKPYNGEPFLKQKEVERPIAIEDGVFIGYGVVILPGAYLSKGCIVGANSVVKGRFESGSIIAGSPARLIRKR
ncbi:acyltransferase [bacterium endosymbiont of Bathymodiolus sp. 5 South]|jgi:acetyltransferase-like isoleucine patch superfamily enzyme|uniref:acyltransferase n=1 Tax=bacterium endosymbiont of Bathymodiolus sp. 5 South TaxID=1181670 RepID=UPI0015D64E93|nr:acyltransferase [bacterium endosymbiont of Bathymodiolus sp. 5 South]